MSDGNLSWLEIFEAHFRGRHKGFLVFDNEMVLRYMSDYACEVLETDQYQNGMVKLDDILPLPRSTPDLLLDPDNYFQMVHDIVIMTPAGRTKEVRVNFEQQPGNRGMVVWIEPKVRDITLTLKKVSAFDQIKPLKGLFDALKIGYLLLDTSSVVVEYNDLIKHLLRLSGEWRGKVIFNYPPLQERKFREFIHECFYNKQSVQRQKFKIKYSSSARAIEMHFTGIQVSDPRGEAIGALICAVQDK